jgi:hypothetical protein
MRPVAWDRRIDQSGVFVETSLERRRERVALSLEVLRGAAGIGPELAIGDDGLVRRELPVARRKFVERDGTIVRKVGERTLAGWANVEQERRSGALQELVERARRDQRGRSVADRSDERVR